MKPSPVRHNDRKDRSGSPEQMSGLHLAVVMRFCRDNDTSVIRGPATMKAGRLDSYGAVRRLPSGEIPYFLGSEAK